MSKPSPFWIAQRNGQDWRDEDVLRATAWLTSVVDSHDWSRRMDSVRSNFESGKRAWASGNQTTLFDPHDAIAWYLFQANAYATQREDCYEPEAFRIAPVFKRLGQIMPQLNAVSGIMDRVQDLMTNGRRQPDDALYELLVAGAYKRTWTDVTFVPEQPGIAKTQDLVVTRRRSRWAVECKRVNRSGYEAQERNRGEALAAPVHELCRSRKRSIILEVAFDVELFELRDSYLVERVEAFLSKRSERQWADLQSRGQVREIDWALAQAVLQYDDVFFGSSRMVELLAGKYVPHIDYSVVADWIPASERPLHATAITQASVVGWMSTSPAAAARKARHFRSLVAKAANQLPSDCLGVIHVGYEARDGNSVDHLRHLLNRREIETFNPGHADLRWVYGNYLSPEHTTAQNESAALSETTATYKIGRHHNAEPLPDHLLFSDEQGIPGHHW